MSDIKIVSFGGGLNSTAMIIGLWQRQIRPDLILFADTGGERPETYHHIGQFNNWLLARHYPEITIVWKTYQGQRETLEQNCLRMKALPSIAYGFKSCSMKYKLDPQERYCNSWEPAQREWLHERAVTRYIGFDAGEDRRARPSNDKKYINVFPLIDWGWHREECQKVCQDELAYIPPKSSCFFCPNMRKPEIIELQKSHPELLQRAFTMEQNAELTMIKGLGRKWSWKDFITAANAQQDMFCALDKEMPCGCYDGE